jgi:hypothetical protein
MKERREGINTEKGIRKYINERINKERKKRRKGTNKRKQ